MKRMQPTEIEHILMQRSKDKLLTLKNNIYQYLISPKDAFRQFNPENDGLMKFEQFCLMLRKLSMLSQGEEPVFSNMKDMFDFVDIRKDGVIRNFKSIGKMISNSS